MLRHEAWGSHTSCVPPWGLAVHSPVVPQVPECLPIPRWRLPLRVLVRRLCVRTPCSSVQDDSHSYLNAVLQLDHRNARMVDGGFSERCVHPDPLAAKLQQVDQVGHNLLVLVCPAHVLTCQKPARGSSDTAQPKSDVHLMLGPSTCSWRLRSPGAPPPSAPRPRPKA